MTNLPFKPSNYRNKKITPQVSRGLFCKISSFGVRPKRYTFFHSQTDTLKLYNVAAVLASLLPDPAMAKTGGVGYALHYFIWAYHSLQFEMSGMSQRSKGVYPSYW